MQPSASKNWKKKELRERINSETAEVLQQIEECLVEQRKIIEDTMKEVTKAVALCSKCDWYEAGDSNSQLFQNLEKERTDKKWIRRLEKGLKIGDRSLS